MCTLTISSSSFSEIREGEPNVNTVRCWKWPPLGIRWSILLERFCQLFESSRSRPCFTINTRCIAPEFVNDSPADLAPKDVRVPRVPPSIIRFIRSRLISIWHKPTWGASRVFPWAATRNWANIKGQLKGNASRIIRSKQFWEQD